MVRVKVRGIYVTALSKLFSDEGFRLARPSVEIAERLGIRAEEPEFDVEVQTRMDRHGIIVSGREECVGEILRVLRKHLDDAILRRLGAGTADVEFPILSKKKLDSIRRLVFPTIEDHHLFKSWNPEVSGYVDQAERLLTGGFPPEEVREIFMREVGRLFPHEGGHVDIAHVKLSGQIYNLGRALVEKAEAGSLTLVRTIRGEGLYDGLEVRKEPEDVARSFVRIGGNRIFVKYFSRDGRLKGMYVNIGTGVEPLPNGIRYVDLEVDVCVLPSGEVRVLDEEKLDEALQRDVIGEKLHGLARRCVEETLRELAAGAPFS